MKFLITGAAGFVGSHLTKFLLKGGFEVIALDLSFPRSLTDELTWQENLTIVTGSVLDESLLQKLISACDYVIHLAAIASPEYYVKDPKRTIDLNLNASISIIEQLRFTGKHMFYTSTSEVFGKNPNIPWDEKADRVLGSTDINRWCYSTSKAMIEHYMHACFQEGSLKFSGVRIFNCYGPRLNGRVVDGFVTAAAMRKPLIVHGDGNQTRCFTYIDDLISAIYTLLSMPEPANKFYNVGSSVETTINELAATVCEVAGLETNKSVIYKPHSEAIGSSYEDIPRRVPNYSAAKRELGWTPVVSLRDGISRMYDYTVNNLGCKSTKAPFMEVDE